MTGTLFIVATPIGNLGDVSARALEVLAQADIIACEDTRTTRTLLARHGIAARTVALHAHNERTASAKMVRVLQDGQSIALVSDAGTPAVSDPGAALVEAVHRAGIRVVPMPGPSAALAAYSAAGFVADRFLFAGFLPAQGTARRRTLESLDLPIPVILYEAPHRILETIEDMTQCFGMEREIVIARELTKKFEEIARMRLGEAQAWLQADPHRVQGEFVLVVGPGTERTGPDTRETERILDILLESQPPSVAAALAARITGVPRNVIYRMALARGKQPAK